MQQFSKPCNLSSDQEEEQQQLQNLKKIEKFERICSISNLIQQPILKFILQRTGLYDGIQYIISIKNKNCKHYNGCVDNLYLKSLRGFLWGYLSYALLNLFGLIKKGKINLVFQMLCSKNTFKFSMFLTVMNFVTNTVQCTLKSFFEQRNLKKFLKQDKNLNSKQIKHFLVKFYGISTNELNQELNDNKFENNGEKTVLNLEKFESLKKEAIKNSQLSKKQQKIIYSLAGALAGFMALATQPQQSRKIWVIFTMTRALDFLYNGMVSRGYIPKWKYSYVLIFALINMLTVYAYSTDPKQVTMGIIKHYNFVYNPHKQDDLIRTTMIMKKYNHLKSKGINEEFNFEHAKAINKEIKPILIRAQDQYLKNKQII